MENQVNINILQYAKKANARVFDTWMAYPSHTETGKENLARDTAALNRQGFTTKVVTSILSN